MTQHQDFTLRDDRTVGTLIEVWTEAQVLKKQDQDIEELCNRIIVKYRITNDLNLSRGTENIRLSQQNLVETLQQKKMHINHIISLWVGAHFHYRSVESPLHVNYQTQLPNVKTVCQKIVH